MGKQHIWIMVGIFLFTMLVGVGLWPEKEKKKPAPKVEEVSVSIVEAESVKNVHIIKNDTHRIPVTSSVKKKKEIETSIPVQENRDMSKEAFMARAEKRKESLAQEDGAEALKRYYEKKEKRKKRMAARKARKEARRIYHKKVKVWRTKLKAAKESGDERLIQRLKQSRPTQHFRDKRQVDTEQEIKGDEYNSY